MSPANKSLFLLVIIIAFPVFFTKVIGYIDSHPLEVYIELFSNRKRIPIASWQVIRLRLQRVGHHGYLENPVNYLQPIG
jgi:hypothetical protein